MNNFRVETYNNPNDFYKEIKHAADSLHIVGTSALSMHLKSGKGLIGHKDHVWTYANLQKAIYREWHAVVNTVSIKIEIRSILEKICSDQKNYIFLLNDIDGILSDYKFYIESGISNLENRENLSEQIRIVRKTFNIFRHSSLVKETYYNYEGFSKEDIAERLNKYYKEVLLSKASREEKVEPKAITNINRIYVYNLTHIDAARFNFFSKLSKLGVEIVFRIPSEGFRKPWESTYKFIDKNNWSQATCGSSKGTAQNKYTAYLKGDFAIEDNKNITFKAYVDPDEFKLKLQQSPIFQNNKELIKWRETNNPVYDNDNIKKEGIEYKKEREYLTFSKETYNELFNGTILNYLDRKNNFLNFNEGRFLKGLYNSKWDEKGSNILIDYSSYCDCVLSGWIEVKNEATVISGRNASVLLMDLKPHMNGVKSIDDILNKINSLIYLPEFSNNFDALSKEKADGDGVKEYLNNPLKVISDVDDGKYEVTVEQLVELTKRLKEYLQELIPKGNRIDIKAHKEQLIKYWKNISYVSLVREEYSKMCKLYKVTNDINLRSVISNFVKINFHYLSFEKNLKTAIDIEPLCTISEVKQYMKVVLKMTKGDDEDDSELSKFNYIKLFDQLEGIMVNGTKEIYVTDLSEKSIHQYVNSRKAVANYSDEETFKKDIEAIKNIYTFDEINAIIQQIAISDEEIIEFVQYYIGALISFSNAEKIEFSWIKGISSDDQKAAIYKILSSLYENSLNENTLNENVVESKISFNNKDRLLSKNDENKSKINKIAKAEQTYSSYEFIKGIELSESQRKVVDIESNQIIINGSAGSGKSIVMLYKLIKAMIEEKEPQRFLYISYNQTLIEDTLKRAGMYKEFENLRKKHQVVDICTFHKFASNMLNDIGYSEVHNIKIDYTNMEKIKGNGYRRISALLYKYMEEGEYYNEIKDEERLFKSHDEGFVRDEILWMKANGFVTKDLYLDCERAGRGSNPRLMRNQRKTIFRLYEEYTEQARGRKWTQTTIDLEDYALTLLKKMDKIPKKMKYDYIFVDEVQDFDAMQLKLLAMFEPKSLILAGDPKQKIYKRTPHSYISLGIDIKHHNNKVLHDNFRSTEEIMNLANSLKFSDAIKDNNRVKYVNKGEKPKIMFFNNWDKAIENIGSKIKKIHELEPRATIALITREEGLKAAGNDSVIKQYLGRFCKIINIEQYGQKFQFNNEKQVIYTDLYNVKGLEFDYVFLLQFDSNHYPNKAEMELLIKYSIKKGLKAEDSDQDKDILDLRNTERKRLYVAMSRAKKSLEMFCVMGTERGISPFIRDFDKNDYEYSSKIVTRKW